MPLVLLRNCAANAIEAGIEGTVTVESTHEAAKKRRDGDGVIEARAAIGNAQFNCRIVERGADRPPDIAFIRDDFRPGERGDILLIVIICAEQFWKAGARQFVIRCEAIADEAGEIALPERRRG